MGRLSLRMGTMSHGREATKRRNAQQMSESWPFESWRDVTVPLTDATNRDPDITFGDFDDEDDSDGGDAAGDFDDEGDGDDREAWREERDEGEALANEFCHFDGILGDITVQLQNVRLMVESRREEMAEGEALASDTFLNVAVVRTFTTALRRGLPLEDDEMEVVVLKDATNFLNYLGSERELEMRRRAAAMRAKVKARELAAAKTKAEEMAEEKAKAQQLQKLAKEKVKAQQLQGLPVTTDKARRAAEVKALRNAEVKALRNAEVQAQQAVNAAALLRYVQAAEAREKEERAVGGAVAEEVARAAAARAEGVRSVAAEAARAVETTAGESGSMDVAPPPVEEDEQSAWALAVFGVEVPGGMLRVTEEAAVRWGREKVRRAPGGTAEAGPRGKKATARLEEEKARQGRAREVIARQVAAWRLKRAEAARAAEAQREMARRKAIAQHLTADLRVKAAVAVRDAVRIEAARVAAQVAVEAASAAAHAPAEEEGARCTYEPAWVQAANCQQETAGESWSMDVAAPSVEEDADEATTAPSGTLPPLEDAL